MSAPAKYVCIHGHFYQPPRENPWLEAIEQQDSAYPYHDWNERITAECYAPNSASRIKDGEDRITGIVNNYAKISFNFGPTLLSWLEQTSPEVYGAILAADEESRRNFSGHGSAMAQAYNHLIMPLACRRDKITQIRWGLRDFESRFHRAPEGMWLAETAVDLETLDLLAEHGIRFTVLAPNQARRVRKIGESNWEELANGGIDPSMAYRANLPSGRHICLFFYDGPISRAVAFEGLLKKGEYLADRILGSFSDARDWPQLAHIATDGETYGHHHAYGDMALAYAIHHIESNGLARITNYGDYLERHPPLREVEIHENSSWSCVHGVERWRSDCGCNSGMHGGWKQHWRAPLRVALDWLRDQLAPLYERKAADLLRDPWQARDEYSSVILDRSPDSVSTFLARHAKQPLDDEQTSRALQLLELQRHAMLMYTSCGWFFDELSGIETVQVIQYAGRAIQLSQELGGDGLEPQFLDRLEQAKSNIPEHADGRKVYEKFVRPAMVDLQKVAAHYAISSLFESYGPETQTYCYSVAREDYRLLSAGKARLALGRVNIRSDIDCQSARFSFGVFHPGDHNVGGGVRPFQSDQAYAALCSEITGLFEQGDHPEVIRRVDRNFGTGSYSLKLLFRDEQRRILRIILESAIAEADAAYRQLYEHYAPLLRSLTDLGITRPRQFHTAAEFTLNADLRRALKQTPLDIELIRARLAEAQKVGVTLDRAALEFALRRTIERLAHEFRAQPQEIEPLQTLAAAAALARTMPFEVNLWVAQNVFHQALQKPYAVMQQSAAKGEEDARRWLELFTDLGQKLQVRLP